MRDTDGPARIKNFKKVALEKGYLHKIVRNRLASLRRFLRTLRVMYETKYQQFCTNLVCNLQPICAMPPRERPLSRGF